MSLIRLLLLFQYSVAHLPSFLFILPLSLSFLHLCPPFSSLFTLLIRQFPSPFLLAPFLLTSCALHYLTKYSLHFSIPLPSLLIFLLTSSCIYDNCLRYVLCGDPCSEGVCVCVASFLSDLVKDWLVACNLLPPGSRPFEPRCLEVMNFHLVV